MLEDIRQTGSNARKRLGVWCPPPPLPPFGRQPIRSTAISWVVVDLNRPESLFNLCFTLVVEIVLGSDACDGGEVRGHEEKPSSQGLADSGRQGGARHERGEVPSWAILAALQEEPRPVPGTLRIPGVCWWEMVVVRSCGNKMTNEVQTGVLV